MVRAWEGVWATFARIGFCFMRCSIKRRCALAIARYHAAVSHHWSLTPASAQPLAREGQCPPWGHLPTCPCQAAALPPQITSCERCFLSLWDIWAWFVGGTALGNGDAIWGCEGDSAACSARGMVGGSRSWCCLSPNHATSSPALRHLWTHAPPEHLRTTGLPFSLVTFHSGTPFNFSYHSLTFGIFTVHIISTYFLPCLVVWQVSGFWWIFFPSCITLSELEAWGGLVMVYLGDPDPKLHLLTPNHWSCKITGWASAKVHEGKAQNLFPPLRWGCAESLLQVLVFCRESDAKPSPLLCISVQAQNLRGTISGLWHHSCN